MFAPFRDGDFADHRLRRRGYVAMAVSGGSNGTVSKEMTTDCGSDRQANMVAFAVEALRLVKEVLTASAKI
jgi:hypothetical protein